MKELFRGAEAVIYKIDENSLLKKRVKKGYRVKELDIMLRKKRTKKEVTLLHRAAYAGLNVPKISMIKDFEFRMEYVKGELLKHVILRLDKKALEKLFFQVGCLINIMHSNGIIHGDLTTSNMILRNGKVYFIDFSLGNLSDKVENKAVDLHLIKQALIAKHNRVWKVCFNSLKKAYKDKKALLRLKKAESRGRKK